MAMNSEEFIALVKRAEEEVARRPRKYRTRLLLFALLGYAVIFGMLVLLLSLVTGSVVAGLYSSALLLILVKSKLIFLFLVMAWVLVKSLWVSFDKPNGFLLRRNDYPHLFAEIDKLRKELDALPIHQVILTPELNAAVVQTPRLGIFGWQFNTLFLGLELLMILSAEQARAVIAHELGHLSHNHSRFGGWIYRVRISWERIMHAFSDKSGFGVGFIKKFFGWYAPRFTAYSFALARSNEFAADAMSAKLTSRVEAGQALVSTHVIGPYVNENYWRNFIKYADEQAVPKVMPWDGLSHFLAGTTYDRQDIELQLKNQLGVESSYYNTHPSLSDRLRALGVDAEIPPVAVRNAAQEWLRDGFQDVVRTFDDRWYQANAEQWKARFEYASQAKEKLKDWQGGDPTVLSSEDLLAYASLSFEFVDAEKALPLYQLYQERNPNDPGVAYAIGVILFDRDSESCLPQFEKAVGDSQYCVNACQYAHAFLARTGRQQEAEKWAERAQAQLELDRKAEAERSQVTVNSQLVVPQMADEQLQELVRQLRANKLVSSAWLAQKVVKYYKDNPVYIIAFKTPLALFRLSWTNSVKQVIQGIEMPLTIFFVVYGGNYKKLAKHVMREGRRII